MRFSCGEPPIISVVGSRLGSPCRRTDLINIHVDFEFVEQIINAPKTKVVGSPLGSPCKRADLINMHVDCDLVVAT